MTKQIHLNGATFCYNIVGPDDAPLIITLHGGRGFGDHASDFGAYSPLSDRFRVLSFDFRGHGHSSVTPPLTFRQLVDDVDAFRRAFVGEEGKVVVCGGSFGGYIAQQYAIEHPAHLSHLILRGTAPSYHHEVDALSTFQQRLHRAPCASIEMVHKVFSSFADDTEFRLVMFALGPLYSEAYDANAALRKNRETVFRAETHNELYSEREKYFDYRDRLQEIRVPTLILVGDKDWICPPGQSRIMSERIRGSVLRVFENANHGVHLEKNEEVLEEIRRFLA